jgi:uncharacterized protein (TIGR03083 family)
MVTTASSLVAALDAQWLILTRAIAAVAADRWEQPSVLPAWTVADLCGHLIRSARSADALGAAPPATPAQTVAAYVAQYGAAKPDVAEEARVAAAHRSPAELAEIVAVASDVQVAQLGELSARPGAERLIVIGARGPLRLADFVATRLIEVVVHTDDLARSVDAEPDLDRAALGPVCRTLAGVIAERHPGHAVEVRVPPFAAVQCVEGPRHTRGTPPNVVETDPLSWLRLATGRLPWAALVGDGHVRASGDRSDLSELLPLL